MKKINFITPILFLCGAGLTIPLVSCGGEKTPENPIPVESITITGERSVDVNHSIKLHAKILPENATNKSIDWSVDDDTVAKIDSQGQLLGKSGGSAKITAKAKDGSGIESTFIVSVLYPFENHLGYALFNGNPLYFDSFTETYLCDSTGTNQITLSGLTMNRSDFNLPIYLSSNLYTINEYFLNNCSSFNSPIFLPNSLVTIDKYFLYNCSAFNQMIDLPDSLRYIYSSFLRGCKEFNNDIHLSKNIEKVGNNFLYDCYKMSMTVYIDCDFNKLDQKDDYQNKTMFAESNVGAIVDPTPMYICCDDIKGFNQLFPAYIVTGSHRRRLAYHECPFQTTGRIYTCHSRIWCYWDAWSVDGGWKSFDDTGYVIKKDEFNSQIFFGENLTEIPLNFLKDYTLFNQPINMPDTVKAIGSHFLDGCTAFNQEVNISNSVSYIPEYFMNNCTTFNKKIILPDSIKTIDEYFLAGCNSYNNELILSNYLEKIGKAFLWDCRSFNQTLSLPNSLTSVDQWFLRDCENMTSVININNLNPNIFLVIEDVHTLSCESETAPMFVKGIPIQGTMADKFIEDFPRMSDGLYRWLYKYEF